MRLLVVVEALFVAAFAASVVAALALREPPLPAIDVAALAVGQTEERWMGIYLGDQHVGWAVSREAPTADGGVVVSQQSSFRVNTMGSVQDILLAGTALVGADGVLRSFDFLLTSPVKAVARGELRGKVLYIDADLGGDRQSFTLPVRDPPVLAMTLPLQLRGGVLEAGATFSVPFFDPMSLSTQEARVRVDAPEALPDGETGWWLTTSYGTTEVRRLVDAQGVTLREEAGLGLSSVRMTKEEALDVDGAEPPDLVALAAAPLEGNLPDARSTHFLAVRVQGVEASRLAHDPPLQRIDGDVVSVSVPLLAELPTLPVREDGPDTVATLSLPADHADIRARAAAVVGDAPDRLEAVRRLNQFVYEYLQKVPVVGVPNGLEVLRSGKGDCNEHTALFVSLARAAGIPARIAAGLVWSSRLGDSFYYHAWPEVRLGGPTEWVPVDPTFGQLPADATHLKVVNGDLDKQIEIMGLMGKIRLALVDAR